MKTGLHSFSRREAFKNPDYNVFRFLDEAHAWGFTSVEIMTGAAGGKPADIGGDDPAHLEKVCAYARERGIAVHCFSTYNDFAFVKNEAWRLENIKYVQQWTRLAGRCGVPNLRLLSGYWSEGRSHEELESLVIEATRTCCAVAEREGVNLSFENHSTIFLYAADIQRLMDAVASPRLTACPDPTNGFPAGKDAPAELERMYANLEALAPKATNAHLKIFGVEDGALAAYDFGRIARIFAAAGYDGPLHFELVQADADPRVLAQAREIVEAALERARLAGGVR
ncbi:MAG: sugar phosphate isomerase/epimerase [Planctomycetota bacterium]|nr:sugar phosphate isomerase/epimerase [Planctomycetota bacterium]